ncbi:hypothetical protein [Amycolatopsis sp. NPDC004079]|uniref:hypothetical protein n=1 Tax=Amycolatopsis sp. NPDC004079 TaxID=3154549 RepID=UPI00339F8BAD
MSNGYTFYLCDGSDEPYRRSPDGVYEQHSNEAGGWVYCLQNDRGLRPVDLSELPNPARSRAFARPVR